MRKGSIIFPISKGIDRKKNLSKNDKKIGDSMGEAINLKRGGD